MKKTKEHIRQYTVRKTTKMMTFFQRIYKIMKYFNQNIPTIFKKAEDRKRQNTVRKNNKDGVIRSKYPVNN